MGMVELEKAPGGGSAEEAVRRSDAEGCLVVAIRIPVRIVVLVLVLPVRMVWDALVVAGRVLRDTVLRPFGRALAWLGRAVFVWPLVGVWRYAIVPLVRGPPGSATCCSWCRRCGCTGGCWTPVGHGLAWFFMGVGAVFAAVGRGLYAGLAWLARYLVVVPAAWLYAWVLTPVGHALAWCGRGLAWCGRGLLWCLGMVVTGVGTALYWTLRVLLVPPALALWRWVLTPVGRVLAVIGRGGPGRPRARLADRGTSRAPSGGSSAPSSGGPSPSRRDGRTGAS